MASMESSAAKSIMIVEDSPDLQALLGRLLKSEDYTVTKALNGRQALDLLKSMRELPSVILLDLMMPVMDGVEFRAQQLKDARLAAIPVVVMTADSNFQINERNLGETGFIRKPITDIDRLLKTLNDVSRK